MLITIPFLNAEAHFKRSPLSCYLISGDDFFLKQDALVSLRKHLKSLGFTQHKSIDANAKEELDERFSELNSFDLFQEKECVEITLPESTLTKSIQEKLAEVVNAQNDSQCFIFIAPKFDEKNLSSKWIQTGACPKGLIQIPFFSEKTALQWIMKKAEQHELKLDSKTALHLYHRCKNRWFYVSQLFEKCVLLDVKTPLTTALVDELSSDESEFSVFEFVDTLLALEKKETLKRLYALKQSGVDPILVLWIITKELRTLIQASHERAQSGFNWAQFCQKHRIFKYREPLLQNALKRFDLHALETFLISALEIEFCIKGITPVDPWEALERFCNCMGLCHR